MPQITNLKLDIPQHYKFMVSNRFFTLLGMLDKTFASNYFQRTTRNKSALASGSPKISLDIPYSQKSSSVHHKQINRAQNEIIHSQPSRLLASMQVSDLKTGFTLMDLIFLKLDAYHDTWILRS